MKQIEFENLTVKYVRKPYLYFNDEYNDFKSVGSMKLLDIKGDMDWILKDNEFEHLCYDEVINYHTTSPFDIIMLFDKLINKQIDNKYIIKMQCIHPMWIYHDLLHAFERDLFPGNSKHIDSVEPYRIEQQFRWCLDNNIKVSRQHFSLLLEETKDFQTINDVVKEWKKILL